MSTVRAATDREVDVFTRLFADEPQLATYSEPARRLLAVAAALFHRQGAAATSIRDITTVCRLTPGAFYRHFASKDDALDALVTLGHARMESRVAEALAEAGSEPRARLAGFVGAYVTGHLEQPELAQVVRREYLHLSPERHRAVVARRRALRTQLADLLADGIAAGQLDLPGGAADRTRVAVMMLDMCSRTSDWYHADSEQTPQQMTQLYVTAALRLAGAALSP